MHGKNKPDHCEWSGDKDTLAECLLKSVKCIYRSYDLEFTNQQVHLTVQMYEL